MEAEGSAVPIELAWLYEKFHALVECPDTRSLDAQRKRREAQELPALRRFLSTQEGGEDGGEGVDLASPHTKMDGFRRMEKCMLALDALDHAGWKRSYFQRKFHHAFLGASARAFFKIDGPGAFQRAHQKIMQIHQFDNLNQEILISTPRRFGKTISVSMFAAALLFSCAGVELSIYSTCKRIRSASFQGWGRGFSL